MSLYSSLEQLVEPRAKNIKTLILVVPTAVTLLFVKLYATPMPLTDEWLFLRAVIALENATSLSEVWNGLPFKIYEHVVIVPFLLYWPISEIFNFDNRALVLISMAAYVIILFIYRSAIFKSTLASLPVALILFSPSVFMTFLWGFTFTFALSILFSILGLAVFNRMDESTADRGAAALTVAGISLCTVGTFSSSGGFFGFPAALILIWLKRIKWETRIAASVAILLVGISLYIELFHNPSRAMSYGLREALVTFTAFGSTVWGSPVGMREFPLNLESATGIALVAIMAFVVIRAAIGRHLSTIAFPASLFVFSLLPITAIAIGRPYLGNWQLQYALPGVTAVYATAFSSWRWDNNTLNRMACALSGLILSCTVFGYYTGFTRSGPDYNSYVRGIENYAITYLESPDQPIPYPSTAGWNLDESMVRFLMARGHPVFDRLRISENQSE